MLAGQSNSMRTLWIITVISVMGCQPRKTTDVVIAEDVQESDLSGMGNPTLSSYGFFRGDLKNLEPTGGVIPYEINSALFSDYAYKKRFLKIPEGTQVSYNGQEVFDFPEGTVLIKNFYYPADFRHPEANMRILETRLLILREGTWVALPYVWNESQTEAYLQVAGKSIPVSWTHSDGRLRKIDYSVPDINQCKGCHLKGEKVMPIGPSARQLNWGVPTNQLVDWQARGVLAGLPELAVVPKLASYDNPEESTSDRARAWLEINCAHCHRPDGQAKTSGLHLMASITSPLEIGVGKAPIAAGKGSGGRRFSLVPSRPDESILLYRIESTDPGVMMPEMGRKLVHEEGVELVRRWILGL